MWACVLILCMLFCSPSVISPATLAEASYLDGRDELSVWSLLRAVSVDTAQSLITVKTVC